MSTHTITEFLEARIAEDEDAAGEPIFRGEPVDSRVRDVLAGHAGGLELNASRLRAECEAKRVVLESLSELRTRDLKGDPVRCGMYAALSDVAASLCAVYSDHPDYNQEWAL